MRQIVAIAAVTFREVLRRKVQVNLLVFGSLVILASFMLSKLTIGEQHRILSDLGLSAATAIGTLIAVFVGSSLVAGDIERRVLQPVVAKPASRTQYLLGRYLGLSLALLLNLLAMAILLSCVLCFEAGSLHPLDASLGAALLMMAVQFLVVAAVAILFSSVTSTTLAAIFTLALAMAGHLTSEVRAIWQGEATWIPKVIWYLVPNLNALSLNASVIYRSPVPAGAWLAALYGAFYAAAALSLASLTFERRDLR
ncbi:MAG TPA: ABC transporter permease subunit [Anaeromyxobacteraceae bacterium]|nr:ABC transporter permease subunit [Anaeromyxobacteraceae bacterium]